MGVMSSQQKIEYYGGSEKEKDWELWKEYHQANKDNDVEESKSFQECLEEEIQKLKEVN